MTVSVYILLRLFFAVLAGGQLFGFFGVLLALPVAAVFNGFRSAFTLELYGQFILSWSRRRDMISQLALNLHLRDDATMTNYVGEAAVRLMGTEGLCYVWGGHESGRSHLLQALVPSGQRGRQAGHVSRAPARS